MAELDLGLPVGVVGAGTMGAGIAQVAAVAGHPVRIHDAIPGAADEAVMSIRHRLDRLTEKGRIAPDTALDASQRLSATTSTVDLRGCGLVVEAVSEDLAVKRDLFITLEALCGPATILASNTSSLSITDIAAALEHPSRVAGLHFFNPAPLMPLVEVVAGDVTDDGVVAALAATMIEWGKTPVRCTSTPGFIVNRVARPYYAEAFRLLAGRAIDPATLDAILRESGGFRMGPAELTDLIGQDVNAAVTRTVWEALGHDARFEPSDLQDAMVADGRLGRKSGGGFFNGTPAPGPATATSCPAPTLVTANGSDGPLRDLIARLEGSGIPVRATRDRGPIRIRPAEGIVLQMTDGQTAGQLSRETGETVVLVDVVADAATAGRFAIAAAPETSHQAMAAAVGCLQATGADVTIVADTPGMVVGRTVAMLASFGADAVDAGVASAADVDTAMRLGVNYPRGPLEWGDELGWGWVAGVLDALADEDTERYRVLPGLRERAAHELDDGARGLANHG